MPSDTELHATNGPWWAAYDDDGRQFVIPVMAFDGTGRPYVWSAGSNAAVLAVRPAFVGLVSDAYRGEYGPAIADAIKRASGGHAGEARQQHADGEHEGQLTETLRDGVEKARDVIHDVTAR